MQTLWLLLIGSVALPLLAVFYGPPLLLALLLRAILGLGAEERERMPGLRRACLWIWGIALTLYVLLTD